MRLLAARLRERGRGVRIGGGGGGGGGGAGGGERALRFGLKHSEAHRRRRRSERLGPLLADQRRGFPSQAHLLAIGIVHLLALAVSHDEVAIAGGGALGQAGLQGVRVV